MCSTSPQAIISELQFLQITEQLLPILSAIALQILKVHNQHLLPIFRSGTCQYIVL